MKHCRKLVIVSISLFASVAVAGGSYNPESAVSYAQQWAYSRNPAYRTDFQYDCTNFFSQIMRAGGLTDDKVIFLNPSTGAGSTTNGGNPLMPWDTRNWYYMNGGTYNPSSTSFAATWTVAQQMYLRMKMGVDGWKYIGAYNLGATTNIAVNYGDAVFAQWQPQTDPNINHAMLVTGFQNKFTGGTQPRLTYHSNERLNNPFSDFRTAALATYPNTKIYIFRRSMTVVNPPWWQIF